MTTINVCFGCAEIQMLQNMIGKTMQLYKCDPFLFTPSVYGIVGFVIDGRAYALTNTARPMDYYGAIEDVAIMALTQVAEKELCSMVEDNQMIVSPVEKKIVRINVINENQKLFQNGEQTYDVQITRGLIFFFDDGSELSFEKNVWFSEDITIGKGEDLINHFTPVQEFADDWEGAYCGECSRTVVSITGNN